MGAARFTVTGKIGPGNTLTAAVFTNVTFFDVDCLKNVLHLVCDQGDKYIDISADTTWTVTITGTTYTMTIS